MMRADGTRRRGGSTHVSSASASATAAASDANMRALSYVARQRQR